jgi:CheY-like chemotaxis protein
MRAPEILLIDDSPGDVLLISRILEELSISVKLHLAWDGRQALAMLPYLKLDLVILDLNMPMLGGFDVLERRDSKELPIVVFTSSGDEADRRRSLELGAREFIQKPMSLQAFKEAVRGIVERWAAREGEFPSGGAIQAA